MIYRIGQILVIAALSLLFLAYSNFGPTVLRSDAIVGYVKNHFVREMLFGIALTVWAIKLAIQSKDTLPLKQLAMIGSVVIFPFWIAYLLGWSDQGLAEVWGGAINPNAAYMLHGSQVVAFLLGLVLMSIGQNQKK